MIWLMSNYVVSNKRPKLEFCSTFHYDVTITFVYELMYDKIASTTIMINAI